MRNAKILVMNSAVQYSIPLVPNDNGSAEYTRATPRHRLGIQTLLPVVTNVRNAEKWLLSGGRDGQLIAHSLPAVSSSPHNTADQLTIATNHQHPSNVARTSHLIDTKLDWINDLTLINGGQHLLAASSDGTVTVYPHVLASLTNGGDQAEINTESFVIGRQRSCGTIGNCYNCRNANGTLSATSPAECLPIGHTDSIQKLAACDASGWFASGGLDNKIILWDGKDLRQFLQLNDDQTTGDVYQPSLSFGERSTASKSSIYALNASRSGDFIVSGSADNLIKIWDARSGKKEACLVGHGDLIRALLISSDGRTVVSAAADGLVKVWSMVTLKCLYSFADFSDSVWSLASAHPTGAVAEAETDYLQAFYAGGRDGLIMFYDNVGYAADADVKRRVIGQQQSTGPVSSLTVFSGRDNNGSVWSASSQDSVINGWPATGKSPLLKITGEAGIIKHQLLDNRRQAIVKRLSGEVEKWDILRCRRELIYRSSNFDQVLQTENRTAEWSPKWCSVDSRTGLLTVRLTESTWTDGEAYADEVLDAATADASAIHFAPDQRVNLGCWVLDSLLSEWAAVEKQRIRGGEDYEPNSQENKQPGGSSLESINGAAGPTEDASTTFNSQPNSPVLPRLFGRKQSASSTAASDASNHPKGDAGKIIAPTRSSSIIESAAIQRRQSNRPLHKEKSVLSTDFEPPLIQMPSDCQLAITETVADRLAPIALFQGTLGGLLTTTKCHQTLVDYLPLWAYKFVVKHMVQPKPVQKLTFTLCPAVDSQLPTLPAGTERLAANRAIRVRKILSYVVDKLNLSRSNTPTAAETVRPEEWLELCYDSQPLDPLTSLATVRVRYSIGSEVPLTYRMIIRERL